MRGKRIRGGRLLPAALFAAAAFAAAPAQETRPAPESAPARPAGRVKIEGVAAIVNDDVITESELDRILAVQKETYGFPEPERWRAYRLSRLRVLVEERLSEQAARKRQVSESAIEERVQRRIDEEIRKRGSRGNFLDWIGQQGKSYEDFLKERKSEEYARAFFLQELGLEPGPSGRPSAEIYIRPGAMREYYREHREEFIVEPGARVRILVFVSPSERRPDRAAARERLVEIRARILAGADFGALAREVSDVAAEAGGEIGWIERGPKYQTEIVSFALGSPGPGLSPVLEWPEGMALVDVLEKRDRKVRPFDDRSVQDEVGDRLWRERQEDYMREIRSKLLREAYVWPAEIFFER